jgi:hypothetical protein
MKILLDFFLQVPAICSLSYLIKDLVAGISQLPDAGDQKSVDNHQSPTAKLQRYTRILGS